VGPQLEDGRADLLDRVVDVVHDPLDELDGRRVARRDGGALQGHAGREQLLDDVVVQVAGDARPVLEQLHPLRLPTAVGELEGDGGVVGERRGHVDVGHAERAPIPGSADDEHSPDSLGAGEGQGHHRPEGEVLGEHEGPGTVVDGGILDDGRLAGLEDELAHRVLDRVARSDQPVRLEAHRDGHLKHPLRWKDDGHHVRVGQVGDALGHESQTVVPYGAQELPGDVGRGLEPLLPSVRFLVEARVLDRDACCRGQGRDELLVLDAEVTLGQGREVEVAEHLVANADGYAEESAHRRMMLGKADRADVVADVAQPDGSGIVDQGAEEPLALGQVADLLHGARLHADVDERLQPGPVGPDHPDGAVRRVDQLARRLDDAPEDSVEREVADDGAVGAEQPAEPVLGALDVVRALDQLREQLVELEVRHVRGVTRRRVLLLWFVLHDTRR
jgi:hypothetical protein